MIAYISMLFAPGFLKSGLERLKIDPAKSLTLGEPTPVLGEADIIVKLKVHGIEEIRAYLQYCRTIQGLVKTNTMISLTADEVISTDPVDAYILTSGTPGILDVQEFEKLHDIGVVEAHAITGPFDVLCEVVITRSNQLKSIISVAARIRKLDGVLGTATLIVIKEEDLPEGI
jgi:hypothetical protein